MIDEPNQVRWTDLCQREVMSWGRDCPVVISNQLSQTCSQGKGEIKGWGLIRDWKVWVTCEEPNWGTREDGYERGVQTVRMSKSSQYEGWWCSTRDAVNEEWNDGWEGEGCLTCWNLNYEWSQGGSLNWDSEVEEEVLRSIDLEPKWAWDVVVIELNWNWAIANWEI